MVSLKKLEFPKDAAEYEQKVRPLMLPEDYGDPDKFINDLQSFSYWIFDGEIEVGWCAVRAESRFYKGAAHLYGCTIWPEFRGKGYGKSSWFARMALFPNQPMTVSIQPTTVISLKIAKDLGFEYLSDDGIWKNYIHWV